MGKKKINKRQAGLLVSINTSEKKGTIKSPVKAAELVKGLGIRGDAHAGFAHRQVSLLMMESIEKQKQKLKEKGIESCELVKDQRIGLEPGVFAENFTTKGIDLASLKIGDELRVSETVRLRVSQIGKECHTRCAIYKIVGDCIMPVQGIFCEVLQGGKVKAGDRIEKP